MLLLNLLDVGLDFVDHFSYLFHLVEELVHEAVAPLDVDGHLVGSDILFVALGLQMDWVT